jgi:hypothetical protein
MSAVSFRLNPLGMNAAGAVQLIWRSAGKEHAMPFCGWRGSRVAGRGSRAVAVVSLRVFGKRFRVPVVAFRRVCRCSDRSA